MLLLVVLIFIFMITTMNHTKLFRHTLVDVAVISQIAVEEVLRDDTEMLLLVVLIWSDSTDDTLIRTWASRCRALPSHGCFLKNNCIRCDVETSYCKALMLSSMVGAFNGSSTIRELSAMFLARQVPCNLRKTGNRQWKTIRQDYLVRVDAILADLVWCSITL
jgi:hypothetical protein